MVNRRAQEPEAAEAQGEVFPFGAGWAQRLHEETLSYCKRVSGPEWVVHKGVRFFRDGKQKPELVESGEPAPPAVVAAVLEDFARQRAWVDPPRGE